MYKNMTINIELIEIVVLRRTHFISSKMLNLQELGFLTSKLADFSSLMMVRAILLKILGFKNTALDWIRFDNVHSSLNAFVHVNLIVDNR